MESKGIGTSLIDTLLDLDDRIFYAICAIGIVMAVVSVIMYIGIVGTASSPIAVVMAAIGISLAVLAQVIIYVEGKRTSALLEAECRDWRLRGYLATVPDDGYMVDLQSIWNMDVNDLDPDEMLSGAMCKDVVYVRPISDTGSSE